MQYAAQGDMHPKQGRFIRKKRLFEFIVLLVQWFL